MSSDRDAFCPASPFAREIIKPDGHSHLDKIRDETVNAPPPPRFHGLNIGIAQLGVMSNGSLRMHVNLGIVDAGANVGLQNGADAGVHLGPIADVRAGAFVGADQNGFHGNAGARARALGLVGAGGEANARLGDATGAEVAAGAHVGDIRAGAGVGAGLGDDGLDAAVTARGRAGRVIGLHTGGHLGLNNDSEIAVAGGGNLGDLRSTISTGIYSDRDTTFRPDLSISGAAGCHHGVLDLNQPIGYPSEPSAIKPVGPDAKIDSKALPPAHEAATPENIAKYSRETLAKLCHENKYTVHKGDTYASIAAKLMPGTDDQHQAAFAKKLQQMNESNGYKGLHNGLVLNTDDPYSIERKCNKMVAEHFGLDTKPTKPVPAKVESEKPKVVAAPSRHVPIDEYFD